MPTRAKKQNKKETSSKRLTALQLLESFRIIEHKATVCYLFIKTKVEFPLNYDWQMFHNTQSVNISRVVRYNIFSIRYDNR